MRNVFGARLGLILRLLTLRELLSCAISVRAEIARRIPEELANV